VLGWLLGKRTTPSRCDRNKTPTLSGNSSLAQTRPCACPKLNCFQRKVSLVSTATKFARANSDAESVKGFLLQPDSAIPTDYVLLFPVRNGGRRVMRDTIRYEIFKDDPPRSPRWLEAVEGLEQAMNRIEELATNDPSSDYYLYCNQADKLIRHLRRTSTRPDEMPLDKSQKKTG
jgi:hypothetical protein